jgi:hypothetical protein
MCRDTGENDTHPLRPKNFTLRCMRISVVVSRQFGALNAEFGVHGH